MEPLGFMYINRSCYANIFVDGNLNEINETKNIPQNHSAIEDKMQKHNP